MRRQLLLAVSTTFLWLMPGVSAGQTDARLELTPRLGLYRALDAFGPAAPVNAAWYLQLERADPTLSFGLSADVHWPGQRLGLRFSGQTTLPANVSGFFNCYPGLACPAILLTTQRAQVSVQAVVADAVLSPLARSPIRPYALLGAGLKRYHYSWPDAITMIEQGSHSEIAPTLHGGLGLAFDVFGTSLHAEVADYWSPEGDTVDLYRTEASGGLPGLERPLRRAQHDLALSMGWQIRVF